jgi:N-acetylmuramoyl-L-alanine amidase
VPVWAGATEPPRDRFDTVVIDPGHGGEDEGARGRRGLAEKELVLDVSRRLAARLREQGIRVLLTRSDDTFVPLEVRTSVANDARGDLFVSIHANSAPSADPSGIETFFVSLESSDESARRVAARENEAFGSAGGVQASEDPLVALLGDMIVSEHMKESSEFSKLVQHELSAVRGGGSRGVKQAPFVVLMGVQMPASLIEIGFLSNGDDEQALADPGHRDAIAEAVTRAVVDFGKRYDARRGVGPVSRRD